MSVTNQGVIPRNRIGDQTFVFNSLPSFAYWWTVVGKQEHSGPLGNCFDEVFEDELSATTSEKAEREILSRAIDGVLKAGKYGSQDIDLYIGGDLLNQIVSTTFNARKFQIPYLGIYNACATFGEGVTLGAALIDGGFANTVMVAVVSSYQTAERQYRYPIELNIQRKATNQNTVSGAGAVIISNGGQGPKVSMATVGRVVDPGEKDTNNMGCAMAPAAADTLLQHLNDTGRTLKDYDMIMTGDLATFGSKTFRSLVASRSGISLGNKHFDGGLMMYRPDKVFKAGASGCACSATVTLGYVLKEFGRGKLSRALIMPTGALHSPLTSQQGETIPCMAHAFVLEK